MHNSSYEKSSRWGGSDFDAAVRNERHVAWDLFFEAAPTFSMVVCADMWKKEFESEVDKTKSELLEEVNLYWFMS